MQIIENVKKIIKDNFIIMYSIYYVATFLLQITTYAMDYAIICAITKYIRYILYIYFGFRLLIILPDYKRDFFYNSWKQKKKTERFILIIGAIVLISSMINFITTGNKRIIILIVIILSSYKVEYKKIIKQTIILQFFLTVITVLGAVLGITQDFIRFERGRHSLGFTHPNNLSQIITFACILYVYYKTYNITFAELMLVQIMNYLSFIITDSRASFVVLEIVIILTVVYKIMSKNNLFNKICDFAIKLFVYTFPTYPLMYFFTILLYPLGGIINRINVVLNNRIVLPYNALQQYGISLFGKNVTFIGNSAMATLKYGALNEEYYNYVDSEYMQMLFKEGIIIAICFIIIMSLMVIMLCKKKKYKDVWLCGIYLTFGLIEPKLINLLFSPILFLIIPTFKECFYINRVIEKNE